MMVIGPDQFGCTIFALVISMAIAHGKPEYIRPI